jgi:hypothetical protein
MQVIQQYHQRPLVLLIASGRTKGELSQGSPSRSASHAMCSDTL